ncbi:MAG: hypothetical protein JWP88_1525 [Flaviaesturariibacter sp.]|nr:hypothetical protein [Flaviaesturariibacter sp.]
MITIYFQNNRLVLTRNKEETLSITYTGRFVNNPSTESIATICQEMVEAGEEYVIFTNDEQQVLNIIKQQFTIIQAGGGFVYTPENQVLLIFRRGKWDLPKGKLDDGETIETCAIREVQEETGVAIKELGKSILTTYHHYQERGESILKESHWYFMQADKQVLSPQTEEDIEKCEWVNLNSLSSYFDNTHPSIRDVIIAAKAGMDQE